ncbi:MAG: SDR family oxidoreductase [Isosphaeraceae bacterium]|nr:SDR family oxidoreductase [Isosphaeraceae bacterium]
MSNGHTPEVVVITGASAGVGRATARAFARRGAYLGLIARGRGGREGARRDVEEAGGRALVLPLDVADPEAVEAAAAAVEREFGPIDIWVNAAMVTVFSPVQQMTPEEYRRVTEVTYLGYVHGTLAALRRMLPRDRGTIVQVGSAMAYRSIPLQSAYCAAKAAIRGFTDSLRCELIHDKSHVHITMVQLPGLNTPQFEWGKSRMPRHARPVAPVYQPEVAAKAIVWAAHHRRRELWVGLTTVETILAQRIAPGFGDWYGAKTAYSGQQMDEPANPSRAHNLWEPLDHDGDFGAHGRFDREARRHSLQLWASKYRGWLALAAGIMGLTCGAWLVQQRARKRPLRMASDLVRLLPPVG